MNSYPIVPGRGIVSKAATDLRLDYMKQQGHSVELISDNSMEFDQISRNIESFIGSVEIPLGLVGPLLFRNNDKEELIYTAAGTLEGALVASMNRGAKAVSLSGGMKSFVIHQKMVRCPMFIFDNMQESIVFMQWLEDHFEAIKKVSESYSNHAHLENIQATITGKSVHSKFIFSTGDASGQNMTTTCTWHAILWIQDRFTEQTGIQIVHAVVEGNGASDKKVSSYSLHNGRGIHVVAECHLEEGVLNKILRTTSEDIIRCFNQSQTMAKLDGMIGYNINVANAIAAMFVATGQDLASIHESGCGILNVEKTARGLYMSLNLPCLVIGTIGGGTHLPKQKEVLEMMGCYGQGKVKRFAEMIAGFALALELSTYAAIVSGQFAKAHEKLGRNKPVNWLLRAEVDRQFIEKCLNGKYAEREVTAVSFPELKMENGIITELTGRVSKKLIGFMPVNVAYNKLFPSVKEELNGVDHLLLKSKALDTEVIKGLHLMASAVDTRLSDLIRDKGKYLEYNDCHLKEIRLYEYFNKREVKSIPVFFGKMIDEKREIYTFLQELLKPEDIAVINSENDTLKWNAVRIKKVIADAAKLHQLFSAEMNTPVLQSIPVFEPWKATELYTQMLQIIRKEYQENNWDKSLDMLEVFANNMQEKKSELNIPATVVHNDFNSRNIALRINEDPCIYDWELAMVNIPHRDIVEFLSFVLPENVEERELMDYLKYHYSLNGFLCSWEDWKRGYSYAIQEYLLTRISFYLVGSMVVKYGFAERVFNTAVRMLTLLNK